jgi:ankyrin repeat protein
MLGGITPTSDEVNRQSSAIAKRREQLRRWDESETNRESSNIKISQRVKFQQAYVFLAACSSSDRDEVEKLLQRGVDINTSNIDGLTALHQACIDNNLLMVEYLLNRSADINCQDNEGWTPLHAAASCGNMDIVKYLLSRCAIVDVCNNEGELPIDIAEGDDIIACLEDDMRRKGIDDEQARNIEHQLMLKHAQDWLNNNQKTNSKSLAESIVHARTGATALHVACAKGYLDVIDILLRAGANINSVDNDGWTPLHAAAHWDKHDVIKHLLDKNADLDAKNYAGQTPLDVCDGVTYELLQEIKSKRPPVKSPVNETPDNILAPWKRKPVPSRPVDEQKSILRSELPNEKLETTNKPQPQAPSPPSVPAATVPVPQPCLSPSSTLPLSSADENLSNCSPSIKEKLTNLQRSLHDLSNRYLKTNQDESINSTNNDVNKPSSPPPPSEQWTKQTYDKLGTNLNSTTTRPTFLSTNKYSQRTFTNPLQSLTTNNNNNNDFNSRVRFID